ncbi:ABC transporter substrate-binding protein [Flavihumibacter sp. ZG627]|uniref:ABC transporter substrate-binding protein n=1 Tax=Flavihumibacter sp. ZG627 TaxID=1463156 RepID=UPI00057FE0DF|nr:helical backbone metal receptor [Flavihumibacter sp. ZG627]KIC89309.1 iron ABC transporter [Flavihumibacter sp. ZG627]
MTFITDQTGNSLQLDSIPQRIISLVPSQTELLYSLGLNDEVVGITRFCIHPQIWHQGKTRIGGTKDPDILKIISLKPDLVIANKEENIREHVEEISKYVPVYISDVYNLPTAIEMIGALGEITGRPEAALEMTRLITERFSQLIPVNYMPATAYLIWKDPWMAAGGDTFISDMMERCGFMNIYKATSRYPEITIQELKEKQCRLLLLSSEPYPFRQKHLEALQAELPETRILLVDGSYFSWYGSRLLEAPAYFSLYSRQNVYPVL